MLNRLRLYWEQSQGDDRCVLLFLLVPLLLSLSGQFPLTFPFWVFGALAGFAGYRRFAKPGLRLLGVLAILAIVGVTMLNHGLLSSTWTAPLSQMLWFCMAVPAGMHFGTISHPH